MRRDARSAETRERHERSFFYLCFVVRAVKHNTSICDAVRCVRARVLRLGRNASLTFFSRAIDRDLSQSNTQRALPRTLLRAEPRRGNESE